MFNVMIMTIAVSTTRVLSIDSLSSTKHPFLENCKFERELCERLLTPSRHGYLTMQSFDNVGRKDIDVMRIPGRARWRLKGAPLWTIVGDHSCD